MEFFDENASFSKKMTKFKKAVERLFYYHFGPFSSEDLPYSFKANSSPIDIYMNKNKLTVEIELPGTPIENISIGVHGNILAIRWRLEPKIKTNVNFFCLERKFDRFEKFILLPIAPAKDNISAVLSNGVLSINFEIGDLFVNAEAVIPITKA
ncbi:MAG TPA: Hsp20/alpha crystallin family protein [bacterium]|nr:Hsp20/alpha crystallin family protein [bacterium]